MVNPLQAGDRHRLQTDSASLRRPAQPSNSLASITGAAIQSIFQHLDVASAASLASTCKACFDEHRHQCADIYECACQQLTPELTFKFVPHGQWDCSGVYITVHWADKGLMWQMYRIAFQRKALQEFWSFVWPANLHELIWPAAVKLGECDRLAELCNHDTQIFLFIRIKVDTKEWMLPLPDARAHDASLDKAVVKSLGSAWEHAHVSLTMMHQVVDIHGGLLGIGQLFCHKNITKDAHSSANGLEHNNSDWGDAH